jgi:hypothetical protein
MKNKKFKDLSNNKVVQVTDQFEDIIILDGKTKVKMNQLMDKRYFEDYIDPQSFFKNESFVNVFAEEIKKIPLDDWKNRVPAEEMGFDPNSGLRPAIEESAVIPYDPEIEKQELIEKAKRMYGQQPVIENQSDWIKNILLEDDEVPLDISEQTQYQSAPPIVTQQQPSQIIQQEIKIENQTKMDPILEMFKNVKRNTSFKIDFTVENKIPRIDFIEMMEDSYNTSIIDFLAQEFTDEILKDPSIITEKIKNKLMDLVYPPEVENNKKKVND